MRILLASPFFSQHYDTGWFWSKAISGLNHYLLLWDYKVSPNPPDADYDLAIVLKGEWRFMGRISKLRHPRVCIWPDSYGRTPGIEKIFANYDIVYGTGIPELEGVIWLPLGYYPDIHRSVKVYEERKEMVLHVGTYSERIADWVKRIFGNFDVPICLVGNGWQKWDNRIRPMYLHEYVKALNMHRIAIDLHKQNMGPNLRLFEHMACTFTISDRVFGIEPILGRELTERVTFETPEQARELIKHYIDKPEEIAKVHKEELEAIEGFTYKEAVKYILGDVSRL